MIWSANSTRIAVAVAGLGMGALLLSEYTAHVRADAQAQATIQVQATVQKGLQEQLNALQKSLADREANFQQQMRTTQGKFQQAATPSQLAELTRQLMSLKQPIEITMPAPTKENPNPQPIAQVSLSDAPQVKAYLSECETCKLQVPKLQADLADREKQAQLAQQQIDSLKTQRDAAIKEAKGGNWLHRTVKAIKYLGIGAGAGAALLCGSGHCK